MQCGKIAGPNPNGEEDILLVQMKTTSLGLKGAGGGSPNPVVYINQPPLKIAKNKDDLSCSPIQFLKGQ